jgi:hypothetical protein
MRGGYDSACPQSVHVRTQGCQVCLQAFQTFGTDGGEACPEVTFDSRPIQSLSKRDPFNCRSCQSFTPASDKNLEPTPKSDMKILKPRSRMISVRLSEEEYATLLHLCSATGARSVSDFTRDAMRVLLNGAN